METLTNIGYIALSAIAVLVIILITPVVLIANTCTKSESDRWMENY